MAFESLYVGTGAMRTAQGALDITGHNIANINTEGFSRQRAMIEDNIPIDRYPGQVGTGVHIQEIQRITDDFTRMQLDVENRSLGKYSIQADLYAEIEQVLIEPSDGGLQYVMSEFFNAFQTLANAPEDYGNRQVVLSKAETLVRKLNSTARQLLDIQTQTDDLVTTKVDEINSITEKIAALNRRISSSEASEGQNANDLRDSRELLLRKLNKIIEVQSYEDSNHNLFVEAQGSVLVAGVRNVLLDTAVDENGHLIPVDANSRIPVIVNNGELKGILDVRDDYLSEVADKINQMATGIIEEVNRQHTKGTPLGGVESITGSAVISQPAYNMINSGMNILPQNGTLFLSVYNSSTDSYEEHSFDIDPYTDSVNDIIASINTDFGGLLTASMNSANQLQLNAASGYRIYFSEASTSSTDTSDFLLATGMNTFFTGDSAFSMAVREDVAANANLITAGQSLSPGDNRNALLLSDLGNQFFMDDDQSTFSSYYASIVSDSGTQTLASSRNEDNQEAVVQLLEQRLLSTTGVSLEEEAANLLVFQRMFQAAAKYVQVMDSVMDTLINGMI